MDLILGALNVHADTGQREIRSAPPWTKIGMIRLIEHMHCLLTAALDSPAGQHWAEALLSG